MMARMEHAHLVTINNILVGVTTMKQYAPYEFRFFIDPGHAWLEVPLRLLLSIGRSHMVSQFSYMRGEYVYLEEDCDADIFLSYFTNDEYTIEYLTLSHEAPIRRYDHFWYPDGKSDQKII